MEEPIKLGDSQRALRRPAGDGVTGWLLFKARRPRKQVSACRSRLQKRREGSVERIQYLALPIVASDS